MIYGERGTSLTMQSLTILLITVVIFAAVYHLVPALACRFNHRMAVAKISMQNKFVNLTVDSQNKLLGFLPVAWRNNLAKWLRQAGYFSESAVSVYIILVITPLPFFLLAGKLIGLESSHTIWLGLIIISLINGRIGSRIKLRRRAFTRCLYKIYRFLDLQITAGIKATDAVRGLPEVIRDPLVNPCLVRFAARFELTLNLDQAMDEIRRSFPGMDCEQMSTHLRQCLQTGVAGRSLVRMEELLFTRHFTLMQQDTRRIHTELLIVAILSLCPGIILFLYPLLFEATQAIQSVFGFV
jgi:hypothetical protein